MAIDYAALRTTINSIFTSTTVPGRSVTFIKFDTTPTNPSDPGAGVTNPRASPDASATLEAVFVPPTDGRALGMGVIDDDLLKRTKEIAIVQPGPTGTFDLTIADEVIDGSDRRKILFVEKLQPGGTILLYFVGMAR